MGDIAEAVADRNRMRTEKLEPLYAAREALAQTGLAARNVLAIGNHRKAALELDKLDLHRRAYLSQLERMRPAFAGMPEFDKVRAGLLKMAAELDRVRVLSAQETTGPLAAFTAQQVILASRGQFVQAGFPVALPAAVRALPGFPV